MCYLVRQPVACDSNKLSCGTGATCSLGPTTPTVSPSQQLLAPHAACFAALATLAMTTFRTSSTVSGTSFTNLFTSTGGNVPCACKYIQRLRHIPVS